MSVLKMAKRSESKQQQQGTTARVRLDVRPDTPTYYVNYVAVSHTPYGFTLTVTKIPSPPTPEQIELVKSGKPMPVEAILQIVIPPLLVDGLIKALADQKERYAVTLSQQEKHNEQQHAKPIGTVQ
jgi:hypothetical protein